MCLLISALYQTVTGQAAAEVISTNRRIDWAPGVRGGIPARASVFADVRDAPYHAKGDGVTDDAAAIQDAINACPSGQTVRLPAGTYMIGSAIQVKSGVTLRGDGMGVSTVKGAAQFDVDDFLIGFQSAHFDWDYSARQARDLYDGYLKGSSNITTYVAHEWNPGDFVRIDQLENPTGDPPVTSDGGSGRCTWAGREAGGRPMGQWVMVRAVTSATNATIEPCLYQDYTMTPQGYQVIPLTMAGVENMTIDNSLSDARDTARFAFAANCWLLNVELKGAHRRMIDMYGGLWNTIKGCVLHDGVPATPRVGLNYGPDRAYGAFMNNSVSASLVEDNQFYDLSLPISLEGGPSGNVIAYNFISKINYMDSEWGRVSIGCHGAHPMMNLIEGNHLGDKIDADFTWGSSSHQTYFRNRMIQPSGRAYGSWGVDLYMKSHYFNLVGNVLGTTGHENRYELTGDFDYVNDISIYRLGYEDASDYSATNNDEGVVSTLLRHGNWDAVNDSVVWSPAIAERSLPASLYLTGKPEWWGDLPWPAIGPDLNPMDGDIPAKVRYWAAQPSARDMTIILFR